MTRPECRQKKPPPGYRRRFQVKRLAVSYSRMAAATLSSALSVFTSEFGMGSGGSRSLYPPGKLFQRAAFWATHRNSGSCIRRLGIFALVRRRLPYMTTRYGPHPKPLGCYMVKSHGQLVLVSSAHRCTSTPSLSTPSSSADL